MMQKSTTFTTIFRLKKCYFHYDMQKKVSLFLGTLISTKIVAGKFRLFMMKPVYMEK
jgi:Na+-transporting NADH:ubiquinone oxidoreductase subunit NqrD